MALATALEGLKYFIDRNLSKNFNSFSCLCFAGEVNKAGHSAYLRSLAYRWGRPLCHGSPRTLKMKKCEAKPSSFGKSKTGFSRVFVVRPGFRFSCEKPLVAQTTCWLKSGLDYLVKVKQLSKFVKLLKVNKSCREQTKPSRGKTYSRTTPLFQK